MLRSVAEGVGGFVHAAPRRVSRLARCILDIAFQLVRLAFGAQAIIANHFSCHVLDAAFGLIEIAFDPVLVHLFGPSACVARKETSLRFGRFLLRISRDWEMRSRQEKAA